MIMTETAPPVPPVSRAALRAHLRLSEGFPEDVAEDGLLDRYLAAATAQIERRTAQLLLAREVTLVVGAWTASGHLVLPVGPVAAIASLAFSDGGTVDPAALALEPGRTRQRLTGPAGSQLAPIPPGGTATLVFTAGHGASAAEVPEDLVQAVLMLAAHRFEARDGAEAPGLPPAVAALIAPHLPVRI